MQIQEIRFSNKHILTPHETFQIFRKCFISGFRNLKFIFTKCEGKVGIHLSWKVLQYIKNISGLSNFKTVSIYIDLNPLQVDYSRLNKRQVTPLHQFNFLINLCRQVLAHMTKLFFVTEFEMLQQNSKSWKSFNIYLCLCC